MGSRSIQALYSHTPDAHSQLNQWSSARRLNWIINKATRFVLSFYSSTLSFMLMWNNWKLQITAVLSERVRGLIHRLNPAECKILPLRHPDCCCFQYRVQYLLNSWFCCSLQMCILLNSLSEIFIQRLKGIPQSPVSFPLDLKENLVYMALNSK